MDVETATPAAAPVTATPPAAAEARAMKIASSNSVSLAAPASAPASATPAPAATTPAPVATPAAVTNTSATVASTPAAQTGIKFDPNLHGFFSSPPETIETVRAKVSQLEEKHKTVEQSFNGVRDYLEQMGYEIAKNREGKPIIVAGKEYLAKQGELPDVASMLGAKDLDLASTDPAKFIQKVVQKTVEAIAPRKISTQESAVVQQIGDQDQTVALAEMLSAKHGDAQRFPGLTDPEITGFMEDVMKVDNPVTRDFNSFMMKSAEHYKFGVEQLYNHAWRFIAPQRAQAEAIKKANGESTKPSTPGPSAGSVGPTAGSASSDYATSRAEKIAKSR